MQGQVRLRNSWESYKHTRETHLVTNKVTEKNPTAARLCKCEGAVGVLGAPGFGEDFHILPCLAA